MAACDFCEIAEYCSLDAPMSDYLILCAADHDSHHAYVEHLKTIDTTLLKKYGIDIDKISVTVTI
ncbi:MAG: hypothetical protein KAJ03_03870 [Gammaproteobacteria bacterium]|nr:hypothetical protein [Gammaproteobacteria bacterium]